MTIGPLPDVLKPDIHGVSTHWNRGFMAFQLARRTRTVVLMVPAWPESGFGRSAQRDYARLGCSALPAELPDRLVRAGLRAFSAAGLTADGDGATRVAMLLEVALVVFLGPVER